MILVNPLHGYFREAHLEHVIEEMKRRGAPVLRGSWDSEGRIWHMHEGTHRLRAAKALGIAPVIVPSRWRRSRAAMVRARFAAERHGHLFAAIVVASPAPGEATHDTNKEK